MRSILHFGLLAVATATGLRDTLTRRSDLTAFTKLIDDFELWTFFEELKDITVMVPNDAAYDKLLKMGLDLGAMPSDFTIPILKYHLLHGQIESAKVLAESDTMLVGTALSQPNMTQATPVKLYSESGKVYVETGLQLSAKVLEPDVGFAGGLVHVLDSSLVAPHNITATAWMNGLCKEFLQFMETTGLAAEIESVHDATIFIPSDEAWREMESTLAAMGMNEKQQLLRNHVVQDRVAYRKDLSYEQTLTSVGGQALQVRVDDKSDVWVEDAKVLRTDILWFNGVAHMIDKVVLNNQTNTLPTIPFVDRDQQILAASLSS
ncbi:hypothetical protein CKM354_001287500 [Cercospora kikuchii]|uniref:FAS1 domain-containing protein n=1 Tax=Cercospora kikuchii TaxID=84275 RepID=A0A9P3L369_9PEZI|nr:uncharacterized protein CKM354_001287500 [Cercospora kikuchii]GIZ49857.1 hypothetical protein CKM354_001287500 [Cercospora kikuchii]